MELREYLQLYWRQRWLIITIVGVATVTAFAVAAGRPTRFAVSQSFAVNRVRPEPTPDYQYDGYYALQAADLFSQTVVSWFLTPSMLNEIYARAKVNPEIQSLATLPSRFRVKRYSAQNIVVRFSERTRRRAEQVAAAMPPLLQERTHQLNQDPKGQPLFEIVDSDPVIAPDRVNLWLVAALALITSLVLGLLLVTGQHYLRFPAS
ncbi:MAG: hypothetical protein HYY50_03085 [Candidatus Kerfeldbacteria bacterium]|nr:hypothetical protein [Candidatus Kerfeldbacteria bacterium]